MNDDSNDDRDYTYPPWRRDPVTFEVIPEDGHPDCNVDGCDEPSAITLAPEGHLCIGCAEQRHPDAVARLVDKLGRRPVSMGGEPEPVETPWLRRECHSCGEPAAAPKPWVERKVDAMSTYGCPGCGIETAFSGEWDPMGSPADDDYSPIRPEVVSEP